MALRSSCFAKSVEGIANACGEIQYQQLARKWRHYPIHQDQKRKKKKTKTNRRAVAHIYLN